MHISMMSDLNKLFKCCHELHITGFLYCCHKENVSRGLLVKAFSNPIPSIKYYEVVVDPLYVSQILVQAWTLSLLLVAGKSSHQCRSDSSGTTDRGVQGTQSLRHKGASLTGLKPQTEKVGTLPRRRDTNADSKSFTFSLFVIESSITVNTTRSASTAMPHLSLVISSTIHSTAHTPVMKSLHSVGSRMNSSWAAAASDPSEECMVTVSTLERQHMASWNNTTSTSNRATLSRGSHKRPGTDPSHNGHPPTNSTEKREHCKCQSSWGHVHITLNGCKPTCICSEK